MNSLLLLVPLSLVLLGLAMWAFVAAVRGGQFDDLDTPALDILRDEKNDAANNAANATPEREATDAD
ncbi:cbb3-type cytochrome oxidase assembly protein CcoS [Pseudoxanthomonas sp. CF125]|jgi:cbb3-type cytochrome oxidase maturation protein|uniref:cbb3-type cytochrome oxidase assembly protein CcoS n=1 Tax=Pseudoxanthomonas sp. CF125 TaxID=1855303 RepID=UPI00088BA7CE|nr:cbb3-type cytochrome oxidase assembly protein CcoS [Pseudoxanthomonas sp. CF125]SDQ80407.1 cytochrome oxidase maturation protein, cbb3-type [Pseudoxanthomonas sp. CF125]